MAKYVRVDKLIHDICDDTAPLNKEKVLIHILNQSTEDIIPPVYGRNICEAHNVHCEFKCSICGAWAGCVEGGTWDGGYFDYCPHCGAKMVDK